MQKCSHAVPDVPTQTQKVNRRTTTPQTTVSTSVHEGTGLPRPKRDRCTGARKTDELEGSRVELPPGLELHPPKSGFGTPQRFVSLLLGGPFVYFFGTLRLPRHKPTFPTPTSTQKSRSRPFPGKRHLLVSPPKRKDWTTGTWGTKRE